MTAAELRAALVECGWSRAQLAARLGMHDSTVDLWVSGRRPIPRDRLDDVRAALDGDLDLRPEEWPAPLVAFEPPAPVPPTEPEWVGTCAEDCACPRWTCPVCHVFWAGQAGEHACQVSA